MPVIKLTHNDINEMVRRTVNSILSESVKEVQGSIMAEKEDVLQEIVDYVEDAWDEIKQNGTKPIQETTYTLDNKRGVKFSGIQRDYIILVPKSITKKLGTSEDFDMNIAVNDFTMPKDKEQYFGGPERGTEGTSYGGPEFNKFVRTTMKASKSRIDMYIPSINGELQIKGFYSTLYHEMNHTASRLQIQKKHQDLGDEDLNNLHFFTATNRKGTPAHYMTANAMHPENDPIAMLRGLFGMSDEKKEQELKRDISFIFYALWEITERNARAEGIYGDLKALGATRENFREAYQQTEVCRQIREIGESLDKLEQVETPGKVWSFAAKVMNMNERGKNKRPSFYAMKRYHEAVKKRFLKRSRELLEVLYQKAMKVAALYLQRQEERPQDEPGGGLERLGQLLNTD